MPEEGDSSGVATILRQERERYAVAVLAFCLRHDENFRKHFWEKVCRVPDDPEQMPPINADGIAIEPPEWADLSLTSDDRKSRFMWVIEAKAGAPLQPKQNPAKPEFLAENGYGALLTAHETTSGTKLRYIVLGANEPLGISDGQTRLGISVQQRTWACLLEGMSREGIVKDLIDTFAQLRIGEFYMEKAKKIVVTGGIQDAVKASIVLVAICEHFGIGQARRHLQSDSFEDGSGGFGYFVKQPPEKATEKYLKLQEATRTSGWCLAWFGYEFNTAGETNRAVWFYLDSEKKQVSLKEKLRKQFPSAELKRDEAYCAYVSSPLNQSPNDFAWFQSVVDCAIEK